MRNLQEQVKKAFCYKKLFWPFTVWINCSSDLKHFANSWLSASNFKSFSWSLKQFFLTVGQNNFGNKITFLNISLFHKESEQNFPIFSFIFWAMRRLYTYIHSEIFWPLALLNKYQLCTKFCLLFYLLSQNKYNLLGFSQGQYHD
jgi:hypothetical protein